MLTYQHVVTFGTTQRGWLFNVTDLEIAQIGGQWLLFAVSGFGGGVSSYRIPDPDQPIIRVHGKAFPPDMIYQGEPDLTVLTTSNGAYLHLGELGRAEALGMAASPSGILQNLSRLFSDGAAGTKISAMGQIGSDLIYSAHKAILQLDVQQLRADGSLSPNISSVKLNASDAMEGASLDQIIDVTVDGQRILVAISGLGNFVSTHLLSATGQLSGGAMHVAGQGTGYYVPSQVEAVQFGGQTFPVVAGATSSSISVFRLDKSGALTTTDHIVDELTTRFHSVSAIATAVVDDRAFVFVGGVDDGISVFTLLPDGRLVFVHTIADTNNLTLANVGEMKANVIEGRIALYITSKTEVGITQISFDPGDIRATGIARSGTATGTAGSDVLIAGARTTAINGGAGDDMLVTADASISLTGGTGADIFVLTRFSGRIRITDYQLSVDQLDLSMLGMIRSTWQMTFLPRADGIRIIYGDSILEIRSHNRKPLKPADFSNEMFPIAHYWLPELDPIRNRPTDQPSTMGKWIFGIDAADTLIGGSGPDIIYGRAGNDIISGGGGHDTIMGEDGNDDLRGQYGDDSLRGYDGNDRLFGGTGHDILKGDGGHDLIYGSHGRDTIWGGEGNDRLYGDVHADRIYGEAGRDTLSGGHGDDLLVDTLGNNHLLGGDGRDTLIAGGGADSLRGGGGNDLLRAEGGNDTLLGDAGNDTLSGGRGNDSLLDKEGDNLLDGGHGHDTLIAGAGSDSLNGDIGNDQLRGGAGNDRLSGGPGRDRLYGDDGNDLLLGGDDGSALYGGNHNDTLIGGARADNLRGGAGHDHLRGAGGNDRLNGDTGNDTLLGEAGNDLLQDTSGNNDLDGGDGRDTLTAGAGRDTLRGGAGNDLLSGGAGDDRLYGDSGLDTLRGGHGHDRLFAGSGSSRLDGAAGNDWLFGDTGNDRLDGGAGKDRLFGKSGHDRLYGGAGRDLLDGGAGNDRLFGGQDNDRLKGSFGNDLLDDRFGNNWFSGGTGKDRILAGRGADTLYGGDHNDLLNAGAGRDRLFGQTGDDRLIAGAGNDRLDGGAGRDTLFGSGGADTLLGGAGPDRLTGGHGADNFVYLRAIDSRPGKSADFITDFRPNQDHLDLRKLNLTYVGQDDFDGPRQVRWFHSRGDTHVQIDFNSDGRADMLIRLDGHLRLDADDFLI